MRATTALVVIAVSVPLAACGGGSKDPAGDGESAGEKAALKFARCMREHGVDMPDPGPQGQIRLRARPGDQPKIQSAQKACNHYLAGLARQASPAERERMKDAALAYARCMRQNGVDFPDPKFEGGGVMFGGPGLNPNSPRFKQADQACRKFLPERGRGRETQESGGGGGGASLESAGDAP